MINKTNLDANVKKELIQKFESAQDANRFREAIEALNQKLEGAAVLKSAQGGELSMTELKEEVLSAQKQNKPAPADTIPTKVQVNPEKGIVSVPNGTSAPVEIGIQINKTTEAEFRSALTSKGIPADKHDAIIKEAKDGGMRFG